MKYLGFVIFFISLITLLVSCNKDGNKEGVGNSYDCVFVQNDSNMDGQIDDDERNIMKDCMESSLVSKSDIESNLIGEWELVGHGEGWLPTISQPCGYIIFSDKELTFRYSNNYRDTISTHLWEIEDLGWSGGKYFNLNIISENIEGLFINHFCENYIYGDGTPSDGNMHLYRKMK